MALAGNTCYCAGVFSYSVRMDGLQAKKANFAINAIELARQPKLADSGYARTGIGKEARTSRALGDTLGLVREESRALYERRGVLWSLAASGQEQTLKVSRK